MEKKNILIAGLTIAIILGATAFAALAQNLDISGTSNATGTWNVEMTNIAEDSANFDLATTVTATTTATTATFEVDLNEPGAIATYDITITNSGTIDAKLASIVGIDTVNLAAPTEVEYAITGVNVDDVLLAGGTQTATVTVEWVGDIPELETSKTATITLNYVQNTN